MEPAQSLNANVAKIAKNDLLICDGYRRCQEAAKGKLAADQVGDNHGFNPATVWNDCAAGGFSGCADTCLSAARGALLTSANRRPRRDRTCSRYLLPRETPARL
jgi:hypothetical protein